MAGPRGRRRPWPLDSPSPVRESLQPLRQQPPSGRLRRPLAARPGCTLGLRLASGRPPPPTRGLTDHCRTPSRRLSASDTAWLGSGSSMTPRPAIRTGPLGRDSPARIPHVGGCTTCLLVKPLAYTVAFLGTFMGLALGGLGGLRLRLNSPSSGSPQIAGVGSPGRAGQGEAPAGVDAPQPPILLVMAAGPVPNATDRKAPRQKPRTERIPWKGSLGVPTAVSHSGARAGMESAVQPCVCGWRCGPGTPRPLAC